MIMCIIHDIFHGIGICISKIVHGLFCIPLSISALCIFLPVIMLMIVTGEIKVYDRCAEPHVTQEIRFKH